MTWEAPQDPFERYKRDVTPDALGVAAVSHLANNEAIVAPDNSLFDAGLAYIEEVRTIKDTFRGAEPALQLAVPEVSKLRADRERIHGVISRKGVDETVWRELEASHMLPIDATPAYRKRLLDARAACEAHGVSVDSVIAPLRDARDLMTGPLRPTDENSAVPFKGEFEHYKVEPRKVLRSAMVISQFDPDSTRTTQEHVRITCPLVADQLPVCASNTKPTLDRTTDATNRWGSCSAISRPCHRRRGPSSSRR